MEFIISSMSEINLIFRNSLSRWLGHITSVYFSFCVVIISLSIYPFVYALRKPVMMEGYQEFELWGLSFKLWLVTVQVLGYVLAGFLKEKASKEVKTKNRGWIFLQLTGVAGGSLLLFSLVPAPFNIPFLFTNGLSLGLVLGLIISKPMK